jgi:hypothetical protein
VGYRNRQVLWSQSDDNADGHYQIGVHQESYSVKRTANSMFQKRTVFKIYSYL